MAGTDRQVTQRCWVEVSGFDDGVEKFYLVDPGDTDVAENRIANNCPLAQNLIGTPVGGSVEFELPRGAVKLTVVDCGAL